LEDDSRLYNSIQKESDALKERLFELYVLYTLNKNLNLSLQLEELFNKTGNFLIDSLKLEDFCFMLLDEKCNELKLWKADDSTYKYVKTITFKMGEGISGIVAQTGKSILVQDVSKDERFLYYKGKVTNIGSFLSIPLKLKNNKVIGIFNIHKKEVNAFKESDTFLFGIIAQNIAQTIERTMLYEKAQKDSMFDELTKLYTRRYFRESCCQEFSKAERYGTNFSIIMIDIDHFKCFNDMYGHLTGDEVLRKLASVLRSSVRKGDVISRYGGEEFIILLPETEKEEATLVAEKLRGLVEKGLILECEGRNIEKITITAGVASYPGDGKTIDEVIGAADRFLYRGKECGRNRVVNTKIENVISKVINEKRLYGRYRTALKIIRDVNQLQYIEVRVNNNNWKICAIKDVGKKGFRGELESEVESNVVYPCRAVMDSNISDVFSIRVAYLKRIYNKYQIGAEITDGYTIWQKLFALLTH